MARLLAPTPDQFVRLGKISASRGIHLGYGAPYPDRQRGAGKTVKVIEEAFLAELGSGWETCPSPLSPKGSHPHDELTALLFSSSP